MGRNDLKMEVESKEYKKKEPLQEDIDIDSWSQSEDDDHHETETYKDYDLYVAAKNGSLDDFSRVLHRVTSAENTPKDAIFSRLSPSRNTFLHIAAKHGSVDIVAYVATESPSLMLCKNSSGDTALHVAARAGDESVVKSLAEIHRDSVVSTGAETDPQGDLVVSNGAETDSQRDLVVSNGAETDSQRDLVVSNGAETDNLLRIKNDGGNTAVHEALIYHWESIAKYLIEQDPEVTHCVNESQESVLYLAAKAGFASCVSLILGFTTDQESLKTLMNGRSPIRKAVKKKKRDVLEAMFTWIPRTVQLRDGKWRTPLHYAALFGDLENVRFLLEKHSLTANQNDKKGYFPIHLASIRGHVDIIRLLLQYFPEPVELLDRSGGNILHLAAQYGKCNVVTYILKNPDLRELINMKDKDGNTPLHRASKIWHPIVVSELTWDKRVNVKLVNKRRMTALDIAVGDVEDAKAMDDVPYRQTITQAALRAAGVRRSLPLTSRKWKEHLDKYYRNRVSTLVLVSTIIATVTFAAAFNMPGGYNSSGTEMGTATMLKEKWFHIFVFCDAVALCSSMVVVVVLIWTQEGDNRLLLQALKVTEPLMGFALVMMMVAFTAGVFLAVSKLRWLAVTILVVAITFLVVLSVFVLLLLLPFPSRNWLWRYICYYPFYLLIVATGNESKDEFE